MKKITPHLWFDKEAKEAAKFYVSRFPQSKINHIGTIPDTPSGDCDIVSFELSDQPFMAISAGPFFKLNPSISFFLNFDPSIDKNAKKNLDVLWDKLSKEGKVLMPLSKYPFSEHYGWVEDKYGVSWQVWPTALGEMMEKGTREQIDRLTKAFLKMKKFNIETLKKAFKGK